MLGINSAILLHLYGYDAKSKNSNNISLKFIVLTDNKQIFRNCFVFIYCHLTKVSSHINKWIIFEPNELSITLSTLWCDVLHWVPSGSSHHHHDVLHCVPSCTSRHAGTASESDPPPQRDFLLPQSATGSVWLHSCSGVLAYGITRSVKYYGPCCVYG